MAVLELAWGLGILDRAGAEGMSCVRALCLVFSDIQLKCPVQCPKQLSFGMNRALPTELIPSSPLFIFQCSHIP